MGLFQSSSTVEESFVTNYMINFGELDSEKAFDKIKQPFMLKVLEKSRIQGPYLVKAIYSKTVANIKLNGNLKQFH